MLTRSWVDTIENVVGVVEALGFSVFRERVSDADERLRGRGAVFQRLDDMADLFVAAGYTNVRTSVGLSTWQRLIQTWAARHVFTHNDGVVDEKYLRRVPASSNSVGHRLVISEAEAIEDAAALCHTLADLSAR
ncbi:hypothetical protein ACWGI8_12075 [Streptomyces sp. NPDC054841]